MHYTFILAFNSKSLLTLISLNLDYTGGAGPNSGCFAKYRV